jgi:thiamine pyrophosphate-dependent acetolactate synthase large subunit-like protein
MDKYKKKEAIVKDHVKEAQKERLQEFEDEVRWMQLRIQKRDYGNKLMEIAIDDRINAFIDIEINISQRHPEVLPGLVEERNLFLSSVGIPEEKYLEALNKDLQGRKEQSKADTPPTEPVNPSEALHAIHEEIKEQEQPEESLPADDVTDLDSGEKEVPTENTTTEP